MGYLAPPAREPDTDEHPVVEDVPEDLVEAVKLPRPAAAEAIDELGSIASVSWWRQGVLWHDGGSRVAPPPFYDQEREGLWP